MCKKLNYLMVAGFVLSFLGQAMAFDESLVLYLPLNQEEGTVVEDVSNYANNGDIVGNAVWVEGYNGNGLELVAGSHITIPEIPEYDVTSEVSLLGWVKTGTVSAWARIIDKSSWQTSGFDLALNNDTHVARIEFFVASTTSFVDSTTTCDDNEWHFVVGTFGDKTLRIYVDAVEEGESQSVNSVDINPNDLAVMIGGESSSNGGQQYLGIVDEIAMFNRELSADEIETIFLYGMAPELAAGPNPENEAVDVQLDQVLSWLPGEGVVSHDVYLGTSLSDVEAADRANPMGVLVSQGQAETTYEPGTPLEYGTTYYWRIDEVAADGTIYKGAVWSFATEPYLYAITGIVATTNGTSDAGSEPEKAIDGSGLNANGRHSTAIEAMWLATPPAGESLWLQCTFDKVYKLRTMEVWNHNSPFEAFVGFGIQNATVEYSADGENWTVLGDFDLGRGTGTSTYTANTMVEFGDVKAMAVRLTVNNGYGGTGKYGLSELRFLQLPAQARVPEPADGAVDVSVDANLKWRAGRETVDHEVYLDTTDATTLVGTPATAEYDPGTLDLGTAYSWKVNEIEATEVWEGQVWTFSTEDYLLVDDFETYDDDIDAGTTIWQTWVDGIDDPSKGGSTVGYPQSPFAEMDVVYSGDQAMPLFYDNTTSPYFSETQRTWATPQDWSKAGATMLVIYFRGDFTNAAAPLYAIINSTRIAYTGDSSIITRPLWKQWSIDLTSMNVSSVRTLTLGLGGSSAGGTGVLYVDAIRLYRVVPEMAAPVDPGTDGLGARYMFEGTLADTSGNGYAGTAMGNEIYEASAYGDGQALSFDGLNDYVELPIGPLVAASNSITVATRFNMLPNTNNWQRIFDIGNSSSTGYMFLCPQIGTGGAMRFAITAAGGGTAESAIDTPTAVQEGWHHVAATINADDMTMAIYLDGVLVVSGPTGTLPSDMGQTTQNWLGRSQYTADGYYMGLLDEFRIYSRVLSAEEIRYLAGDR